MGNGKTEIPRGWKWVSIGDIAITSSGGTPDRQNANFYKGAIPWVKSGELNYNVILETEEHITDDAVAFSSAKIFPKGSLLIALYGNTVGRMAFLGVEASTNQAVASIIPFSINSKYLYYYLMSSKEDLLNKREGSAQANISQKILNEYPFPLTNIDEQNIIVNKIEELFSELDTILNIFNELLYKLKLYWLAELDSFFTGQKTKGLYTKSLQPSLEEIKIRRIEEKIKYKGDTSSTNNSNIRIPANWNFVRLSDLYVDPVNAISDGPFGSNLKSSDFEDSGYPVLKIQNIDRNEFINKEISFISEEKFNELVKHQFHNGDIILTKLGSPLGKACIVPKNFKVGVVVADLIRIKQSEVVNTKYLMYCLNSPNSILQIEKLSKGTTRQRITLSDVRNLNLILPSTDEQNYITEKIEEVSEQVKNLNSFIKKSILEVGALKQKILSDAFSGNLISYQFPNDSCEKYVLKIKEEKELYINEQKQKQKLIPKIKKMKTNLDIEEILKSKNEPVTSYSLWQESKYKDNIEEFYKKLKELDKKIKEFKEGHLSYVELVR